MGGGVGGLPHIAYIYTNYFCANWNNLFRSLIGTYMHIHRLVWDINKKCKNDLT